MCRLTLLGDVGGPYNWGDLKRFEISFPIILILLTNKRRRINLFSYNF